MALKFERAAIVGGGISGLTLADKWARRGQSSLLLERQEVPGGLARSIDFGGKPYDLGPHRFFSLDQEILDYILEVLDDNVQWIERKTSIFLQGSFHEWPVTYRALLSLHWRDIMRAGFDMLLRSDRPVDNFEDFIINRYGPTLYRIFFRPMTEKFFRKPCSLIHPVWGTASVDRAIIDKYSNVDSLAYLVGRLVRQQPPLRFVYPKRGGIQAFADALHARCRASKKCEVRLGTSVTDLEIAGNRIEKIVLDTGERLPVDAVVWTSPLTALWGMVKKQQSPVSFLSTVFYYLLLPAPVSREEQWIYLPDARYRVNRITLQDNFYRDDDSDLRGICAEVTATDDEYILRHPEDYFDQIVDDLVRIGLIKNSDDVVKQKAIVVKDTYPLYTVEHVRQLGEMMLQLGELKNLFLLGRSGMFVYNNMDNSIKASIEFDRWLEDLDEWPSEGKKKDWTLRARDRY